jgi:hypothetical protein
MVQRGVSVRRDEVVAVGGTECLVKCSFDAPESSNFGNNSASGRNLLLADFLDRGVVTSRKMDEPSSPSDASTLTRTDTESSCSESLTVGGYGSESLTFGDDSKQLSVAEESLLQARFAERTAMEMAQIVAYWRERSAAADADDLFSEGQSLPSPEQCFPENSLLNTRAEEDEIGSEGDCEMECKVDGEDDDVRHEEFAGCWIGANRTCSRSTDDELLQEPLSRYAPNPPASLRRRRNPAAVPLVELQKVVDQVCERQEWTPRMNLSPLVHYQRLAAHVAALLWISAIAVRWDENGRLAQAAMRGLLQMLILLVRGCLWLLQAALKAM